MECLRCNSRMDDSANFCPKCGSSVSGQSGDSRGSTDSGGADDTILGPSYRDNETIVVPPDPTQLPRPGEILGGRYELIAERGRGGMGVVYRGRDAKLGGRVVAVKLLSARQEGSQLGIERFLREAETVGRLNHPAIVGILDRGEDHGRHYIVMEWMDGEDLEQRLERDGAMSLAAAHPILSQVFQGLSYAHRHSVVHRDIKPSNILITRDGVTKIVDFGLARMASESELSRTGYGLGTLAYMPPEQRRDAKRVDHRSDIYALGKTIYHILTGHVPDPVDPEEMPPGIGPAVMRALKTEPADRWFSMDEFWRAMGAVVQGVPGSGAPGAGVGGSFPGAGRPSVLSSGADQVAGSCPDCRFVNPEDTKFCRECGERLFEICPVEDCGYEQRRGGKHCGRCGVNIAGERQYRDHVASARKHLEAYEYSLAKKEAELALVIREGDSDATSVLAEVSDRERRLDKIREELAGALSTGGLDRVKHLVREGLELSPQDEQMVDTLRKLPALKAAAAEREKRAQAERERQEREKRARAQREQRASEPAPRGSVAGEQTTFEIAPGVRMEFVWIPAGSFRMGSAASEKDRDNDEGPVHEVRITEGFWLGRYQVTQEQWHGVMGSNPSHFKGNSRLPVEQVSWDDTQEFIRRLQDPGYRLPTEAEWEYACRAGTTTPFSTGDCLSTSEANYEGNYPYSGCPRGEYRGKTTMVGSFPANAWGLHDMHGNVWEWCNDWYRKDYYAASPSEDPKGPLSGSYRVLRGGGWYVIARGCRSAFRNRYSPDNRRGNYGFRLARTTGS